MAITRKHPQYPNYNFLGVEEVNQILYNYTRSGFDNWACISTDTILEQYPHLGSKDKITSNIHLLRYDFNIISCTIEDEMYTWIIEVRNTFWTGQWRITDNDGKMIPFSKYSVSSDDVHGNTLIIKGKNFNSFNLCLNLSNVDKTRTIDTTSINIVENCIYKHQFDETQTETITVINSSSKAPVKFATVRLVPLDSRGNTVSVNNDYYLQGYTTTTDTEGKAKIKFTPTRTTGTFYARLEVTSKEGYTCEKNAEDNRYQAYDRDVDAVVDNTNLFMYKGEIKTFQFKISIKNKYGVSYAPDVDESHPVDVYHTYDAAQTIPGASVIETNKVTKKYSVLADKNGVFKITLSSRGFYGANSTVQIALPETTRYASCTTEPILIQHPWLKVNTYDKLKAECENTNGADAIILDNKEYVKTGNDSINIKRKQYIIGLSGSTYPTINAKNQGKLFIVQEGKGNNLEDLTQLHLQGIRVINSNNVIHQNGHSHVTLDRCCFQYNQNTNTSHQGNTLYQTSDTCTSLIKDNFFENNTANCLCLRGNSEITNNLFKITDVKYTHQPEPFVLNQYSGETTLKENMFYINTSLDYSNGKKTIKAYSKNRSYAKISVWVGRKAKVNGKGVNQLRGNNTFNFFDKPYNNRGYIFSIYYYPYSNVRTYICASAPDSRINKATGHAVQGTNWAWRDGYTLVRASSKSYNTNNPYIKIQNGKVIEDQAIYVPTAGGTLPSNTKFRVDKNRTG